MKGEDFRAWRRRLGMTQAAAASALGRSLRWVKSVEAGDSKIEKVVEFACALIEQQKQQNP